MVKVYFRPGWEGGTENRCRAAIDGHRGPVIDEASFKRNATTMMEFVLGRY
jgi:hypothetical protein